MKCGNDFIGHRWDTYATFSDYRKLRCDRCQNWYVSPISILEGKPIPEHLVVGPEPTYDITARANEQYFRTILIDANAWSD